MEDSDKRQQPPSQQHRMTAMGYATFARMIVAGTVIMGAAMAMVMLALMWKMYPNQGINLGILVASLAVFVVSLWPVRSQATVGDVAYLRAMIPHHSIAILTSERAHITDPRVRKLADGIIAARKKEIGEMKEYVKDPEARR